MVGFVNVGYTNFRSKSSNSTFKKHANTNHAEKFWSIEMIIPCTWFYEIVVDDLKKKTLIEFGCVITFFFFCL